jgi:hypothetical protein
MKRKTIIARLPNGMTATLEMEAVNEIIRAKGLDKAGDVQQFHTANVLRRIKRYMPFVTGATYKITAIQTVISKPEIVTDVSYGKHLFYGKVMIDPKINAAGFMTPEGSRSRKGSVKVPTTRNLKYNRTKNPQAGPRWDRTLSAAEGKAMAEDIQRYIKRKG